MARKLLFCQVSKLENGMHGRFLSRTVVFIALAAASSSATAIPFTITGGSATTFGVAVGSTVTVTPVATLAGTTFNLNNAGDESGLFDFLLVDVSGAGLTAGYVDAALNFSDPTNTSAEGVLAGFSIILNRFSFGSLAVWDDPGPIVFGNGGLFDVDFFGFSQSCGGCTSLSGIVQANISLLQAPTSVPEPATLSLLGAGLLVLGFSRRRQRAA